MFKDNFDFVAFITWFESLIDYIIKLISGIKEKIPTTTTTTEAAEEVV
ncbi:MAG: hypothetical protein IKM66_03445 [Clostridia bacterium]|nr:hypothetical protein [Clostridia bacterium]